MRPTKRTRIGASFGSFDANSLVSESINEASLCRHVVDYGRPTTPLIARILQSGAADDSRFSAALCALHCGALADPRSAPAHRSEFSLLSRWLDIEAIACNQKPRSNAGLENERNPVPQTQRLSPHLQRLRQDLVGKVDNRKGRRQLTTWFPVYARTNGRPRHRFPECGGRRVGSQYAKALHRIR